MNSEEFKSLKVGNKVVKSSYSSNGYRELTEYEVTTRYSESLVGIMEVLNYTEKRGKRKQRRGQLLHDDPDELIYFQLA